jgi:hypothetical protein
VTRAGRIAGALVALLFMLIGVALALDGSDLADHIVGVVFFLVAPVCWWLFALRPFVSLTPDTVKVQNPLRRYDLPIGAIMGARASYSGVMIDVRGRRRPVTAWAVQKMNLSTWRGRETRADLVAGNVMEAAYAPGITPATYAE